MNSEIIQSQGKELAVQLKECTTDKVIYVVPLCSVLHIVLKSLINSITSFCKSNLLDEHIIVLSNIVKTEILPEHTTISESTRSL